MLTLSGVGDLVAKFTAIRDWKLAFHAVGEPVDDFAALLSDGTISFIHEPLRVRPGGDSPAGNGAHAQRDRDGDLRLVAAGERQRTPDLARPRCEFGPAAAARPAGRSRQLPREHPAGGEHRANRRPVRRDRVLGRDRRGPIRSGGVAGGGAGRALGQGQLLHRAVEPRRAARSGGAPRPATHTWRGASGRDHTTRDGP